MFRIEIFNESKRSFDYLVELVERVILSYTSTQLIEASLQFIKFH